MTTDTDTAARTPAPTSPHDPPSARSVIGGLALAIVLQIGAAISAAAVVVILFLAAFANFGNRPDETVSTWWAIFAIPLAIAALAIYVLSGLAASRTMRTPLGWLVLLIAPAAILIGSVANG